MQSIIDRVIIHSNSVEIRIDAGTLLRRLLDKQQKSLSASQEVARSDGACFVSLSCTFRQARQGKALRLIIGSNQAPTPTSTIAIVKAIARARLWYHQIVSGEAIGIPDLAERHGVTPRYVNRILRFASLGPEAIEAIVNGQCDSQLTLDTLVSRTHIDWGEQLKILVQG